MFMLEFCGICSSLCDHVLLLLHDDKKTLKNMFSSLTVFLNMHPGRN